MADDAKKTTAKTAAPAQAQPEGGAEEKALTEYTVKALGGVAFGTTLRHRGETIQLDAEDDRTKALIKTGAIATITKEEK